jgi:hypothetical protein
MPVGTYEKAAINHAVQEGIASHDFFQFRQQAKGKGYQTGQLMRSEERGKRRPSKRKASMDIQGEAEEDAILGPMRRRKGLSPKRKQVQQVISTSASFSGHSTTAATKAEQEEVHSGKPGTPDTPVHHSPSSPFPSPLRSSSPYHSPSPPPVSPLPKASDNRKMTIHQLPSSPAESETHHPVWEHPMYHVPAPGSPQFAQDGAAYIGPHHDNHDIALHHATHDLLDI